MTFDLSPWTFFLVFGRTSALIAFFPMFAEAQVPRAIRVSTILWISLAILPVLPPSTWQPATLPDLAIAVGMEAMLGALFALTARLIFSGVMLGAQWIDAEIGFQVVQQINPLSGTPNSPVGILLLITTSLMFWAFGYFEDMLLFWARIFHILPPPIVAFSPAVGETLVTLSSQIFFRALEILTPILVVMFLVTLAIGLMARAVQGVNIFVESYNIKLIIGMVTLVATAPILLALLHKHLEMIPESWMAILRALKT